MKRQDFEQFKDRILKLNIQELRDKEVIRGIILVYNAIGDIMTLIRLPKGTNPNLLEPYGVKRLAKNREISKKIQEHNKK